VTTALFTDEAAEDASLKYSIALQIDEAKGKEKEGAKLPEKFTSKTDFRTYDESFDTWLYKMESLIFRSIILSGKTQKLILMLHM